LLKRKDGGRRKRAKRLQTLESNGFTTETQQGTELGGDTPSPGVFVRATIYLTHRMAHERL